MMFVRFKIIIKSMLCLFLFAFLTVNLIFATNIKTAHATNNIIYISNENDFINLATDERISDTKTTIKLLNNLDFANFNFVTIGNSDNKFSANFDGNGFDISNVTLDNKSLFYNIENATFKNFRLLNTILLNFDTDTYAFAKSITNTTFDNCSILNIHKYMNYITTSALIKTADNVTFNNFGIYLNLYSKDKNINLIDNASNCTFSNSFFINNLDVETNFTKTNITNNFYNCYVANINTIKVSVDNKLIKANDFSGLENKSAFVFNDLIFGGKFPYLKNLKAILEVSSSDVILKSLPDINNVTSADKENIMSVYDNVNNYINLGFNEYTIVTDKITALLSRLNFLKVSMSNLLNFSTNLESNILSSDYENIIATITDINENVSNLSAAEIDIFNSISASILNFSNYKNKFNEIVNKLNTKTRSKLNVKVLNSVYLEFLDFKTIYNFTGNDLVVINNFDNTLNTIADDTIENIKFDLTEITISDLTVLKDSLMKLNYIMSLELFGNKLASFHTDLNFAITMLDNIAINFNNLFTSIENFKDITCLTDTCFDNTISNLYSFLDNKYIGESHINLINTKISLITKMKSFYNSFKATAKDTDSICSFKILSEKDFYIINDAVANRNKLLLLKTDNLISETDVKVIDVLIERLDATIIKFNNDKNAIIINNNASGSVHDSDKNSGNLFSFVSGRVFTLDTITIACIVIFCIFVLVSMFKFGKKARKK